MAAKLQGDKVGKRIVSAYKSRGLSRTKFWNALRKQLLPNVTYAGVMNWEKGTRPNAESIAAIAEVTGYEVEDFYVGLGIERPTAGSGDADERARETVIKFIQTGEHAPYSDEERLFLELCASSDSSLKDGRMSMALLGFRVSRAKDEANLEAYLSAIRKSFKAAHKPESTKPSPPRRRRQ